MASRYRGEGGRVGDVIDWMLCAVLDRRKGSIVRDSRGKVSQGVCLGSGLVLEFEWCRELWDRFLGLWRLLSMRRWSCSIPCSLAYIKKISDLKSVRSKFASFVVVGT